MADDTSANSLDESTKQTLRNSVEQIEKLEEEKKDIAEQIKEVYAEAKSFGFDTKILRQTIRLRKIDRAEREEQEGLLELNLDALGD